MNKFYQIISDFFKIQKFFKTSRIFLIFFLFTLCTLLEFLNIALILPVISFLFSDNIGDKNLQFLEFLNIDNLKYNENFIYSLSVLIIILFLIKLILLLISTKLQTNFFSMMRYKISSYFFNFYISKPYIYFTNEKESSKVMRNITMLSSSYSGFLERFLLLANDFFIFLGIVIVVFFYDPLIFILISSLIILISLIYISFTKKYFFSLGKSLLDLSANLLKDIQESLNNIIQIKLLKKENYFVSNFNYKAKDNSYKVGYLAFLQAVPKMLMEFFAILLIFLLIIVLVYTSQSKEEITSILTLFSILIIRIIPFSTKLISFFNSLSSFAPSLNLLKNELNISKDNDAKYINIKKENGKKIDKINAITLTNVNFKYSSLDQKLFENVTLSMIKNNIYAIFGPSGSGKTTLLNIINGLIKPTSGDIKYNNINLEEIDLSNIGYVTQSSFFQNDTIKKNIAFAITEENIDEKKIYSSLEAVNLSNFIEGLDKGINSSISELGSNFSGGQLQRLSIARAIYSNSDFIIFDEPTSSLDDANREKILDLITKLKKNRIIIIITHTKADLKICDKIFKIIEKKIIVE